MKNLEDLINEYLDTLDFEHEDESFMSDQYLHEIGLKGFLEWLKEKDYEVIVNDYTPASHKLGYTPDQL